jgi:flagellar L-ring protein precursor FlgH
MKLLPLLLALLVGVFPAMAMKKKKEKEKPPTPLEQYVREASHLSDSAATEATAGAIWTPESQFADLGRDLKASQVNDIVTILVSESASAVATGVTKTQRKSSANASVTSLAGPTSPAGALANLAGMSGNNQLDGSGTTSRTTTLSTTLTARVAAVLPNGNLVIEGTKNVQINSENQTIVVRGVIRQTDIGAGNAVLSNRLAQMEINLNGKGVVGDSIRRPNILYRILMGILPF